MARNENKAAMTKGESKHPTTVKVMHDPHEGTAGSHGSEGIKFKLPECHDHSVVRTPERK